MGQPYTSGSFRVAKHDVFLGHVYDHGIMPIIYRKPIYYWRDAISHQSAQRCYVGAIHDAGLETEVLRRSDNALCGGALRMPDWFAVAELYKETLRGAYPVECKHHTQNRRSTAARGLSVPGNT